MTDVTKEVVTWAVCDLLDIELEVPDPSDIEISLEPKAYHENHERHEREPTPLTTRWRYDRGRLTTEALAKEAEGAI